MTRTHKVQIWNHKGSRRTRWYACEVIGRRNAPSSFADAGQTTKWYDVLLLDGTAYRFCNPECVKEV